MDYYALCGGVYKWQYRREKRRKPAEIKDALTFGNSACPEWLNVLIAASSILRTAFAKHAVITTAKL